MRAPAKSIQNSSTPSPKGGAPSVTASRTALRARSRIRNSSRAEDNSFLSPAFYLSETTPLSLHFGELRLPHFSVRLLTRSVILSRALFARRRTQARRAKRPAFATH